MWHEAITVRTTKLPELKRQLPRLLGQLTADAEGVHVAVYVRYPANGDVSFRLTHSTGPATQTTPGHRLAAALRSYGMVDHAVWRPVSPDSRKQSSNPKPEETA